MAITGQWQNLPYGNYKDAIGICVMSFCLPSKVGITCILLHTFHVAHRLRVPLSEEFPSSSA